MATSLLGPGTGQTSESPWSRPTRECQGCAAATGALMVEVQKEPTDTRTVSALTVS